MDATYPSCRVRTYRPVAVCFVFILCLSLTNCNRKRQPAPETVVSTVNVQVNSTAVLIKSRLAEFSLAPNGYLTAALLRDGHSDTLDDPRLPSPNTADSITVGQKQISDFVLDLANATVKPSTGRLGKLGQRIEVEGSSTSVPDIKKQIAIEVYDDLPQVALVSVSYKNQGLSDIAISGATTQQHFLSASLVDAKSPPFSMWSFHGSSEAWGKDDVMFLDAKFKRDNPMQLMMHNDENRTGGGIPVVAFWTDSVGEAIGQAETVPLTLAIPVKTMPDGRVQAAIVLEGGTTLRAGEVYAAPLTFVSVFHGDFYEPLSMYSKILQLRGLSLAHPNSADYQANWCGWGYEMDFTPKQMLGTIPKLKDLGLKWATLDAGWFRARGEWAPRPDTFPGDSLQQLVKSYHDAGIKMTLWWIPIVVEDGNGKDVLNRRSYKIAEVVKQHPDWLILDKNGKPARATANLGALCPALPEVQQYHKQLTEKFIRDWDFDGHKLDFSYTVPACYNPKHHHKSPQDSMQAVGEIYKIILETTRALKPESVTQACPCGTPPSLAWLPYIDQAVTADPVGAKQLRLRTKMYKALLGPESAVYGDHVELTDVVLRNTVNEIDKGSDFSSEVGVGAVLGTKFTWPDYGPKFKVVELTTEKEKHWKKWIDLYNSKMLSSGKFLDLYTYGYDQPEAYAIEKDGRMYYAFYTADKGQSWSGEIELRGLARGRYRIVDYENNRDMGTLDATNPKFVVNFVEHLLLEAAPEK